MEKITLGGKDYRIGFDFSVLIEVEDMFGTDFREVFNNEEKSLKQRMQILYCCMKPFNEGFPSFSEFSHMLSPNDMQGAAGIIADCQLQFFAMSEMATNHLPKDDRKEEDGKKNA